MVARQEAAMNPITGVHLNPTVEKGLKTQEKADVVIKANKGQDRALAIENSYNVINFRSKREGLDPPQAEEKETTKTYIPNSRVPYNIISTLSFEQHHWAKPELRPKETVDDPNANFSSKFIGRQPYNIVSNTFLADHEKKMIEERDENRFKAVKAFWKTHTYDPIEVKYYDENKEQEYHQKVKESQLLQGQSVAENIRRNAPTTHLAEGNLYDPITCIPKNENAIKQLHKLEAGKIEHSRSILQRVGEYLQNEDDFSAVQDDRALNRSKWRRFEDDNSHGFDVINNIPHFGRGAQHKHLPKARPALTAWEAINEEALNSIDAQPLGDLSRGRSVEHNGRQIVDPSVPPLRTQPFSRDSPIEKTQKLEMSQPVKSLKEMGRSQSQGLASAQKPMSDAGGNSARMGASGRIRTGGFQHLSH